MAIFPEPPIFVHVMDTLWSPEKKRFRKAVMRAMIVIKIDEKAWQKNPKLFIQIISA